MCFIACSLLNGKREECFTARPRLNEQRKKVCPFRINKRGKTLSVSRPPTDKINEIKLSADGGGSNRNACGNNKRPSDIRRAGVLYACYPKLHDDDIHRLELFFEGFGKTFVGNEDVDILGAGKGIGHDFADFRAV